MNQRYSFLALLLTLLTCFGASATNTTVTVTEGAAYATKYIDKTTGWVKFADLTVGDNVIDVPGFSQIKIYPVEGSAIVSFKKNGTQEMGPFGGNGSTLYGTGCSFISNTVNDLAPKYVLTVKKIEDIPVNNITINIDDPSKVICRLYQSQTPVTLIPGKNTVAYRQTFDENLYLTTNDFTVFHSVAVNGQPQAAGVPMILKLSPDAVYDVNVNHPASEYNYTLAYDDEDDFWTEIKVNGQTITPADNKFSAPAGANVELYNRNAEEWYIQRIWTPDGREYKGNYVGIDRYELNPNAPITFAATNDGEIRVKAHRIADYTITFNITGLDYVNVLNGSLLEGTPIPNLKEGANTVVLNELNARVTVVPKNENCVVSSVTYRTTSASELKDADYYESQSYYVVFPGYVKNTGEINITAKELESSKITINVTDPNDVRIFSYYDVNGLYPSKEIMLTSAGDNIVDFPESQNMLYILPANESCTIKSVTFRTSADAAAQDATFDAAHNFYTIDSPKEGYIVVIESEHVDYENSCMIYVDDASAASKGVAVVSPAGRTHSLRSGYNTVGFNASENDGDDQKGFTISLLNGSGNFTAFHNNEKLENVTETSAVAELIDGDVYKVYVREAEPRYLSVYFTNKGPVEFTGVTTDYITSVETPVENMRVLPGTHIEFSVTTTSTKPVKVLVGRDEIEAVDGVYALDVTSAVGITAEAEDEPDSIETIDAAASNAAATLYDINGRRVSGTPAPGLYIRVAGGEATKVLVK